MTSDSEGPYEAAIHEFAEHRKREQQLEVELFEASTQYRRAWLDMASSSELLSGWLEYLRPVSNYGLMHMRQEFADRIRAEIIRRMAN